MEINFDDFKVRCSAISMVMSDNKDNPSITEKQLQRLAELEGKDKLTDKMQLELAGLIVKMNNSKKVILSTTCIGYLMTEYAWLTEGMVSVTRDMMDIPQMKKGTMVEPQSLALLSMVDDTFYLPNVDEHGNRERIYNKYLSGEVDCYEGEAIMGANCIPDVKSIFDYPTFLCKIHEPLSSANRQQVQGYMEITKAPNGFIANCLVDTPDEIINGYRYRLMTKMNVATEDAPEFKERWAILERSMRFNHIPPHQRVFKKKVEPMSNFEISALYDRVKVCRDWLNDFHINYQKLNTR